jgi:formate hydrogenlyase subunit 6/NADH:ubiquinone oxidoreductase subunit I
MSGSRDKEKYPGLDPLPPSFVKEHPPIAKVKEEGCIACDRCPPLCFFDAILMEERPHHPYKRVAVIVAENCTGCGLCFEACPVDVIVWMPGPHAGTSTPAPRGASTKAEEYESF